MAGFVKLQSSILQSTVWLEPNHVRILWITMLTLADKTGVVEGSIPGLADSAKITVEECESALNRLGSLDEYSRTKDFEGRRIGEIDGGWLIFNYEKYRAPTSAERTKRWRERRNVTSQNVTSVTPCHTASQVSPSASVKEAEAEAEAEKKKKNASTLAFDRFWDVFPNKKGKGQASKTWDKLRKSKLLPDIDTLITAVNGQIEWRKKMTEASIWIPEWRNPSTWLNGANWEDDITMPNQPPPRPEPTPEDIEYNRRIEEWEGF